MEPCSKMLDSVPPYMNLSFLTLDTVLVSLRQDLQYGGVRNADQGRVADFVFVLLDTDA